MRQWLFRSLAMVPTGLLVGLTPGPGMPAQALNTPTVVRYESNDRLIHLPVVLEGRALWFDVDTGAPHTVIDAAVARRLRIPTVFSDRASGAGLGTVLRQHAAPVNIAVGRVHFHIHDPWVYDLSRTGTTLHEDGLLGADFFKGRVIQIDPSSKTFTVFNSHDYRGAICGSAVPLADWQNHFFIPITLSLANGVSALQSVRVDTGSDDAVSSDLVRQSPTRRRSVQGVGLGESYTDYSGVFSSVQIGRYVIRNAWGPSDAVPAVGMEILRRFVLTFDVDRGVLYLKPTHHLEDSVPSPAPNT